MRLIPQIIERWRPVAWSRESLHGLYVKAIIRKKLGDLSGDFKAAHDALSEFGRSAESEFTQMAATLTKLDGQLLGMRGETDDLQKVLGDHDEDQALASAFELFKKAIDLAHGSIGIALSQEEEMEQMEGRLFGNQSKFDRTSLMFRVLVLNLRTEAARLPGEGSTVFSGVAKEMETLEREMRSTIDSVFSELEAIVKEASDGRKQLQDLRRTLHIDAQRSIKTLRGELEKLKNSLRPCAEASTRISTLLTQANLHTSELITALQYQDIVRQQVEHVGQGFDDIQAHFDIDQRNIPIDLGYLYRASLIQRGQLGTSRTSIENAGKKISETSSALLATGRELGVNFEHMENVAAAVFNNSTIGATFREETATLVRIASESEETSDRISRLLDRIEKSVKVFSIEISQREFDVLVIALNAQVAAVRVPNAMAIEKLSEATADVSRDVVDFTRTVSLELGRTLERLNSMRNEASEMKKTIAHERSELLSGTIAVSDKLDRLKMKIVSKSGGSAKQFLRCFVGAKNFIEGLRFPSAVADSFGPAENLCDSLLSLTEVHGRADLRQSGVDLLTAHNARYTMMGERDVHAAVLADGATPDCFETATGMAKSEGDRSESLAADPGGTAIDPGVELF